jgi:oxidoreductase
MAAPTDVAHRVLLAGAGWMTRTVWLPLLHEDPRFEPVAAIDPDPTVPTALSGLIVLPDLASAEGIAADVAFVATPNATHADVACRFLSRGVSVLVEKPIAIGREQLDAMRTAATEGAAMVVPSAATRLREDVAALAALIAQGSIGEPRTLHLNWVRGSGIPRPGTWYTTSELAGGGAMIDLGWHLLDVGLSLLPGTPSLSHEACVLSSEHLTRGDGEAAWRGDAGERGQRDVEDTALALFLAGDDVPVTMHVAWASHEPRDVTSIAVDGQDGSLTLRTTFGFSPHRVEQPSLVLRRRGEQTALRCPTASVPAEYRRQLDVLDARLCGREAWREPLEEAGRVLDTILRLYAAAR